MHWTRKPSDAADSSGPERRAASTLKDRNREAPAGCAGPVARLVAKHKQSTGLFVFGLGLQRLTSGSYAWWRPGLQPPVREDLSIWTEVTPISRTLFHPRRSLRCLPPSRRIRWCFVNRWSSWYAQVAASAMLTLEFGCNASSIHAWVKAAGGLNGSGTTSVDAPLSINERQELIELRRQLKQVHQELDILAKATAWFAGPLKLAGSGEDVHIVYELVKANQAVLPLQAMCKTSQVSHSGYYDWLDDRHA